MWKYYKTQYIYLKTSLCIYKKQISFSQVFQHGLRVQCVLQRSFVLPTFGRVVASRGLAVVVMVQAAMEQKNEGIWGYNR